MNADQFRAALADLGLSQAGFARVALVDARTVRRWCDGTRAGAGGGVAGVYAKQLYAGLGLNAPWFFHRWRPAGGST